MPHSTTLRAFAPLLAFYLAYFLGKETEELEHELEKSAGKSLTA